MRQRVAILLATLTAGLGACAHAPGRSSDLKVVPHVDLQKYAGTWYEIARFPFRVQEGCFATVATYAPRPDGRISVINQCQKGSFGGELSIARGTARVVDPETNAKLSVTFFWPFSGDYWIVDLGKDYEYSVVSGPERKYLWVLSRSPRIDDDTYRAIVERVAAKGFDVSRLVRTPQP